MINNQAPITPGGAITTPGSSRNTKTGFWRTGKRPEWNREKCAHCAVCFHFCPDNAIMFEKQKMIGINYAYCKGCGVCAEECPFKALRMVEE